MERREFLKKSALATLGTAVAGTGIVQAFNHINDNASKTDKMKIVVLTGSPRKNGNSAYLAEQFIKGAEEKGHEVFRFDCAFKQVEPCRACNRCGMDGPCIHNDDFQELSPHLIDADMVVFATPMYYFGVSAQMKRVIDRFYAINGQINPNRSLDTPSPFLIGKVRLSGILPASVRILILATPRRSPLRLRLGEKHAA